jgi:hypothetical protein
MKKSTIFSLLGLFVAFVAAIEVFTLVFGGNFLKNGIALTLIGTSAVFLKYFILEKHFSPLIKGIAVIVFTMIYCIIGFRYFI